MNLFEQLSEDNIPKMEEAEVKLDLCSIEKTEALQKLDKIVKSCKKSATPSLYISFTPAKQGGGETLFQPIMRYFKIEKLNGYITKALPLITKDKGGIFVVFKR